MTSRDEILQGIRSTGPRGEQRLPVVVFSALIVLGGGAFLAGASMGDTSLRAWQAYLVNFVFWTGTALGSVLFAVALTLTNARWGRSMKRLAESMGAFLPIAFLLYWVIFFGRDILFPWIHDPIPKKEAWLNVPFFFARNGLGLLLLTGVALLLIRSSLRRDLQVLSTGSLTEMDDPWGQAQELAQTRLSIVYGILYAFIMTMMAFDLIMSLMPHWYSTLFGAYYWMGSFYTALAALQVLAIIGVKTMGLDPYIRPKQFHDLGKLTLGFCVMTGDFFYTHLLVQWYGNLPEETRAIIVRGYQYPWKPVAIAILVVCFLLPFVVLLKRSIKMNWKAMLALCGLILCGMWLDKFFLVAPSLWKGNSIPFGILEILITAGFFGAMGLSVLLFLKRYPVLPAGDPLFHEQMNDIGDSVNG